MPVALMYFIHHSTEIMCEVNNNYSVRTESLHGTLKRQARGAVEVAAQWGKTLVTQA